MEWTLRLIGTGIDGQSRSFDVMAISRPDGLGDIANLGLTLAEAKLLLVQVQQEVVAAQAYHHAMFRPVCQSCSGRCHVKDWRQHRLAVKTLSDLLPKPEDRNRAVERLRFHFRDWAGDKPDKALPAPHPASRRSASRRGHANRSSHGPRRPSRLRLNPDGKRRDPSHQGVHSELPLPSGYLIPNSLR
jgi:hypothetical protein